VIFIPSSVSSSPSLYLWMCTWTVWSWRWRQYKPSKSL